MASSDAAAKGGGGGNGDPSPSPSARSALVYLELPHASVSQVQGRQWTEVDSGAFFVLCLQGSTDEAEALVELGLELPTPPSSTAAVSEMYFVTCGEYKIPLHKCIPVIKTQPRSYVFVLPEGLFLGFQFPPEQVSDEEIDVLELLLSCHTTLRQKPAPTSPVAAVPTPSVVTSSRSNSSSSSSLGTRIGAKVEQASQVAAIAVTMGGNMVAYKIDRGAEKLRRALAQGGSVVITKLEPASHAVHVSPQTLERLQQAKRATAAVCTVSGAIADGMVAATRAVASAIAEKISSHTSSSSSCSDGPVGERQQQQQNPLVSAAFNVGSATLYAAGAVLNSATDAGRSLLHATGGEITRVVEYKYGEQAAEVAQLGSEMATDLYDTSGNLRYFKSTKALLKNTAKGLAKETGKVMVAAKTSSSTSLEGALPVDGNSSSSSSSSPLLLQNGSSIPSTASPPP